MCSGTVAELPLKEYNFLEKRDSRVSTLCKIWESLPYGVISISDLIHTSFHEKFSCVFTDHFSGPGRAVGLLCVCVCVQTVTFKWNNLWRGYLAWWFALILFNCRLTSNYLATCYCFLFSLPVCYWWNQQAVTCDWTRTESGPLITSSKGDGCVIFVVCLLATLCKNLQTDLHGIFREGW